MELRPAGDLHHSHVARLHVQHQPAASVLELRARGVALGEQGSVLLLHLADGVEHPAALALDVAAHALGAVEGRARGDDHFDPGGGDDDLPVGGLAGLPHVVRDDRVADGEVHQGLP
jgi:hypothetical protein